MVLFMTRKKTHLMNEKEGSSWKIQEKLEWGAEGCYGLDDCFIIPCYVIQRSSFYIFIIFE